MHVIVVMFPLLILLSVWWLVVVAETQTRYSSNSSPYVSPATVILNYEKMVKNFKVFMYKPNNLQLKYRTSVESLFYTSLHNSTYLTQDPEKAHLFFVPFSSDLSTRAVARVLTRLRNGLPYWNRTLGADHFYLSCAGIPLESDRTLVELKKNGVQISCFPTRKDRFVPHKDVTLPPLPRRVSGGALVNEFCMVEYWNDDVSWIGEALRVGCVPVVVTEGPVNDMPFMDVLRWREMAVFVTRVGRVRRVLDDSATWKQIRMKGLGVVASVHFQWNQPPLPFDAFNTIMYQLWLRRHTVRYKTMQ